MPRVDVCEEMSRFPILGKVVTVEAILAALSHFQKWFLSLDLVDYFCGAYFF